MTLVLERAHALERDPVPDVDVRRGDVDPELDPQRTVERELALEPAFREDVDGVAGEIGDRHGSVDHRSAPEPQTTRRRTRFEMIASSTLIAWAAPAPPRLSRVPPDVVHLSDEALIALAARGEEPALAALYDRYGRVAYGLALRVLRDSALAEDAVQEAFLAVWRSAHRYIPERSKPSTWILTFVHRRAVDLVRREERRRTEQLTDDEALSGGSVDEEAWLRLERERVQAALRQLPDQQREAIELAYYGGFTQSELAERLGQPLGTIKSRMFTGLARLRELLGDRHEWRCRRRPRPDRGVCARCARRPTRSGTSRTWRRSERCRDELAELRDRVAMLAYGVSSPAPPPALRTRILDAAAAERENVVPLRRRRPVALGAVAAGLPVAVGLGIWGSSVSDQLDRERSISAILADPDAKAIPLQGANGRVVVTDTGEAALVVSGLATAPEGKTYEVWVAENGKMLPAGVFDAQHERDVVQADSPGAARLRCRSHHRRRRRHRRADERPDHHRGHLNHSRGTREPSLLDH